MTKIGVIGGGKIGEALIAGLINGGIEPADISVANRRPERDAELKERYEVLLAADAAAAAEAKDVIFLCVKPGDTAAVLEQIASIVDHNDEDTVVVSLAAGITLATLEGVVSAGTSVIRVMPNTPMLVGAGASALVRGRFVTDEQVELVSELLSSLGFVAEVKESQMDAVTAVSGSGPAYFFLFIEAMTDAAVSLGLPRPLAQELAARTAAGAGAMACKEGADPVHLRADVTSPGGTTAAALRSLEESGVRGALFRAMDACASRSAELGAVKKEKEQS